MTTEPLFDDTTLRRPRRGSAARRTVRQKALIRLGWHPLAMHLRRGLDLHPATWEPVRRGEPPTLTCGSCRFLDRLDRGPDGKSLPGPLKCWFGDRGQRVTRGAATDVRRWWPACVNWEGEAGDDASGTAT